MDLKLTNYALCQIQILKIADLVLSLPKASHLIMKLRMLTNKRVYVSYISLHNFQCNHSRKLAKLSLRELDSIPVRNL